MEMGAMLLDCSLAHLPMPVSFVSCDALVPDPPATIGEGGVIREGFDATLPASVCVNSVSPALSLR
jgi:hypothetical protein